MMMGMNSAGNNSGGQFMNNKKHYAPIGASTNASAKRANANASNNSDDEDSKKAKVMDIYKQRQYKKLIQKW